MQLQISQYFYIPFAPEKQVLKQQYFYTFQHLLNSFPTQKGYVGAMRWQEAETPLEHLFFWGILLSLSLELSSYHAQQDLSPATCWGLKQQNIHTCLCPALPKDLCQGYMRDLIGFDLFSLHSLLSLALAPPQSKCPVAAWWKAGQRQLLWQENIWVANSFVLTVWAGQVK